MTDNTVNSGTVASDILSLHVNYLPNILNPAQHTSMSVREALSCMQDPGLKSAYDHVQSEHMFGSEASYKAAKQQLPAIMFQGTVPPGTAVNAANLKAPNGIMVLDFDGVENVSATMGQICRDPHMVFAMISPSGEGIKVGIKVNFPEGNVTPAAAFTDYYKQVQAQASIWWPELVSDNSSCNINRLCFCTPYEAYTNEQAVSVEVLLYTPPPVVDRGDSQYSDEKVEALLAKIDPSVNREVWLRVLMAGHYNNPASLHQFDGWSSGGANYAGPDDVQKVWESFEANPATPVTMASLERLARLEDQKNLDWSAGGPEPTQQPSNLPTTGIFQLLRAEAVTLEDVAHIESTKHLYPNLLPAGAISLWYGMPEAGKSALTRHVIGELIKDTANIDIAYFDTDSSASVAREMTHLAKRDGWIYMNPDLRQGQSIARLLEFLKAMQDTTDDLKNSVLILDTLKKFTGVMNKNDVRKFMTMIRSIATKGCAVLLLAHANKYRDETGAIILEGVQDLANDADSVLALESYRDKENGIQYISTITEKDKNAFTKNNFGYDALTFEMKLAPTLAGRKVTPLDRYIDVRSESDKANALRDNKNIKEALIAVIKGRGVMNQKDAVNAVLKQLGMKQKQRSTVRRVLVRESDERTAIEDRLFIVASGGDHNQSRYSVNGEYRSPFENAVS